MTNTSQQSVVPTTERLLDPELKAKWLEALRSGEYEQGTGELYCSDSLKDRGSFCCLGVLGYICKVPLEELENKSDLDDVGLERLLGPWGPLGDYDQAKVETHFNVQRTLASMNDGDTSFPEIADWIEANL